MARRKYLSFYIKNFYTKGHPRTLKAKRHVSLSFIYRGVDLAIGLALVPLILEYLDKTRYGIWMVLFSLTAYFSFLNVGLEHGLRNKFAESKARGEVDKARYYVSTAYAVIGIISLSFFIIFVFVNQFLDWTKILNTDLQLKQELSVLALFVFGAFSLSFVLKIVTTIAVADQKPSVLNLRSLTDKILKLIFILIVLAFVPSSLLVMGIGFSIIPVLVLTGYSLYFFRKDYKIFRPSMKYVDFHYLKDLMNLGIKFFIISIAVIVLFATDNLIITQLFGPEFVTPYQIAHRYFAVPLMLFMIIVQPLWSAVTEAYTKKEFDWIKNAIKKLSRIWLLIAAGIIVMLMVSPFVYKLWLGDKVTITFGLSLAWAFFVILHAYGSIYTYFINGTGKVKIQTITAVLSIIINIPLSIFLAKTLHFGIAGVICATIFSMIIGTIFRVIQYQKIIHHRAYGIWNC